VVAAAIRDRAPLETAPPLPVAQREEVRVAQLGEAWAA